MSMYYKRFGKSEFGDKTINYYKETYPNTIEVEDAIFVPCEDMDDFHITSVSRDDFENYGYDASGLSDEQMRRIADDMGTRYCEYGGFWEAIDYWGEELNLPRSKHQEDF